MKIKKKTKPRVTPEDLALVIRTGQQKEYSKTHWVLELTTNQKFVISTTTPPPHTYRGLPLSKGNKLIVEQFKLQNTDYKLWDSFNKTTIAFQHKLGNAGESARLIKARLQQSADKIKESTEPLKKAMMKMSLQHQQLGKKLNFKHPLYVQSIQKVVEAGIYAEERSKKLESLNKKEKNLRIETANGLNTLMRKHKLKKPMDIAKHYLDTHNVPHKADYLVDSFDNPIALAQATGIAPKRLFEMVCNELIKSKKLYEKVYFERDHDAVEELLNLFESKVKQSKAIKYTQNTFFISKDRKTWSDKYGYHFKNYKRFNEDFKHWTKVFKSEAKQREISDIEIALEFESDSR